MAQTLSDHGAQVTVCVATKTGAEYLKEIPGLRILIGRKDTGQMTALMKEGFQCCIDATHPYAVEATRSIRAACSQADTPCYRLLRRKMPEDEIKQMNPGVRFCGSAKEACRMLLEGGEDPGKCILLTTGAKEAASFTPLLKEAKNRIFVRVLPSEESIRLCLEAGFSRERILTGSGPYSLQENVKTFRTYGIGTLVTKDGGIEGGFPEKLAAASACGVRVIVIRRPEEDGYSEAEILSALFHD